MENLNVSFEELNEGRNYMKIEGIGINEQLSQLFDLRVRSGNGVQETFRIYNDSNRPNGQVRNLVKATILEEGVKRYNLGEVVGKYIIIDIKKEVSKKGNEFWKINNFEKVTEDTDLSEFEIIAGEKPAVNFGEVETVDSISDLEDMLDKDEQ